MSTDYSYGDPYYAYRAQAGVDAKVVVMGNTGVGKTSIVHRYTEDKFTPTSTTSTTGALFVTKKVIVDGTKVRLQLWDTAGQERFRSMAPMYYRNANAALLVYDITDSKTFDDVRGWLEELKKNCTGDLIIYIVGSKADLSEHRAVTQDRARHALHTWFPPPRPPSPLPSPAPPSNFSYMRPLLNQLPSLPTSSSVPFPSSPGAPDSTSSNGLNRANTTALAYTRKSTSALSRSPTSPTRSRPHPRPIARSAASMLTRPVATATDASDSAAEPQAPAQQSLSPIFGSRLLPQPNGYTELPVDYEDSDAEDEREWGLQKDMKLFEVSAKDAQGINGLFSDLITAIVARRDVIERERIKRERDSVVLNGMAPTWNKVAEEEEDLQREREKATSRSKGWGGGCC